MNFSQPQYSESEKLAISSLTEVEVKLIDESLLNNISTTYRTINRVVGSAMMIKVNQGVPDLFYANRVYHMVQSNQLEYQGEFKFGMCEIRKP